MGMICATELLGEMLHITKRCSKFCSPWILWSTSPVGNLTQTLGLTTFYVGYKSFQWRPFKWGNSSVLMSKPLALKECMLTSFRLVTKEGDGFQCDMLCCNGYTYSFFMCNILLQRKAWTKVYHHSTLTVSFWWTNWRRNIMSVEWITSTHLQFFHESYTGENKVLCHGVAWKSGRGLPKSVIHD